ncbi:rhomboid family intramembrane serine protease [Oceanirhabdus sp. W0125-5]|uniref:rhomboid family intramembrane serine protease n=1 Tax=Oceanirhabdus sp. W0125-5 TaxID=2999116 RepID=UPI0022F3082C|nr:rhomboid family intramembrane serine protease [Oceanirhabdus sp. W0125-5]WBW98686.1 rhomboid family intramembrane serine protease [Oceanirhabdus sp. W0125-5]
MSNFLNIFMRNMMKEEQYEGIRIDGEGKIEDGEVLLKKGEKYDQYLIIMERHQFKDALNYRETVLMNVERVPEIIFVFVSDEFKQEDNALIKNLVDSNIGSVVVIDSIRGDVSNIYRCSGDAYNEINKQAKKAIEIRDGGFKGALIKLKSNWITAVFLLSNILIFIVTAILSKSIFDMDIRVLIEFGALNKGLVLAGQYHRIISSGFLHAGIVHLAMNMLALYVLGLLVEEVFGKAKFAVIYVGALIAGSMATIIFGSGVVISVGASGAIFGLLGAAFAYGFIMRKRIGKAFMNSLLQAILLNVFIGLLVPEINNMAHMGGLFGGFVLGSIFLLLRKR